MANKACPGSLRARVTARTTATDVCTRQSATCYPTRSEGISPPLLSAAQGSCWRSPGISLQSSMASRFAVDGPLKRPGQNLQEEHHQ